jgi:hypothetical protein
MQRQKRIQTEKESVARKFLAQSSFDESDPGIVSSQLQQSNNNLL